MPKSHRDLCCDGENMSKCINNRIGRVLLKSFIQKKLIANNKTQLSEVNKSE